MLSYFIFFQLRTLPPQPRAPEPPPVLPALQLQPRPQPQFQPQPLAAVAAAVNLSGTRTRLPAPGPSGNPTIAPSASQFARNLPVAAAAAPLAARRLPPSLTSSSGQNTFARQQPQPPVASSRAPIVLVPVAVTAAPTTRMADTVDSILIYGRICVAGVDVTIIINLPVLFNRVHFFFNL